jgi:hypothetical protein
VVQAAALRGQRYLVHVAGEAEGSGNQAVVTVAPAVPDSSAETIGNFSNLADRFDVNGDRSVTPLDALLVIYELNRTGGRLLTGINRGPYVDVSRDLLLTSLDVLLVINQLNAAVSQMAEGESVPVGTGAGGESEGAAVSGGLAWVAGTAAYVSDAATPRGWPDPDPRVADPLHPCVPTKLPADGSLGPPPAGDCPAAKSLTRPRTLAPDFPDELEDALTDILDDILWQSSQRADHDRALIGVLETVTTNPGRE